MAPGLFLVAILAGALAETALLSLTAPLSPTRPNASRWVPFGVALLMGAIMLVLGMLPGRHGSGPLVTDGASATYVFVFAMSMGVAVALRTYGRLPATDEATLAVTTGAFAFAIVLFLEKGMVLAFPFAVVGVILGTMVVVSIFPRSPLSPGRKKLAYFWSVYVGASIGILSLVSGGLLFGGMSGASLLDVFLVGMAATFILTQAFLCLFLVTAERGVKKDDVERAIAGGYVTEKDLLPRLESDQQVAPAWIAALLVGTPAILALDHATHLLSDAAAWSIVLVLVPGLAQLATRTPTRTSA